MILIELCLAFVLGALCPLASAPMVRRNGGGWYAWSGVLVSAWMAGVCALLVGRFPDWAVLYLFEAKSLPSLALVVASVVLSVAAAWLGSQLVVRPVMNGHPLIAAVGVFALVTVCAMALYLVRERILHMATTFEYRHGLLRRLPEVAGFRGLASIAAIAVSIPSLGTLLFVFSESAVRGRQPAGVD
jgi:hypothetical protein